MLGTVLATSYADPVAIWTAMLAVISVPSGYGAWVTLQDRKDRKRRQDERSEERRLYEMVGTAFFGPDKAKWPQPGQRQDSPPLAATLAAVHRQVTPSNGVTTAAMVEEVRKDMLKLAVLVGEHMSDGHGGQTWPGTP